MTEDRTTGSECIGTLPWGTHLCQFYSTREELTGTLIPYLSAGLRQDEFCLWVTSDPSGVDGAKTELTKAAPYLDRYLDTGQIEIWDYHDWYLRGGHFDADRVLGQWVEKEEWALDSGYKGLRATGDVSWMEQGGWPDFMAYEAEFNRVCRQHRMIGLCTYRLDRCKAEGVLEVVRNHQSTLGRIAGEWEMIESSSMKIAAEELRQLNDKLKDQRLSAHLLEQQDEERRWIATQLHEVSAQNVCAIAIYLANLQERTWSQPSEVKSTLTECHTLCKQSLEQIRMLSYLLHPPILDRVGLAAGLHWYIEDFMKQSGIHVDFETGPEIGRLPLEMETHLFRVAQEGLTNIHRHSGSLNAIVRMKRQADQMTLQIQDFGRGMPAAAIAAVACGTREVGLGILEMQERVRQIGGRLEIRSTNQGTMLTATVPLS